MSDYFAILRISTEIESRLADDMKAANFDDDFQAIDRPLILMWTLMNIAKGSEKDTIDVFELLSRRAQRALTNLRREGGIRTSDVLGDTDLLAVLARDEVRFTAPRLLEDRAREGSPTLGDETEMRAVRISEPLLDLLKESLASRFEGHGIVVEESGPVNDTRIAIASDDAPTMRHRAPGVHGGIFFKDRPEARKAVRAPRRKGKKKFIGPKLEPSVNVILVDQGVEEDYVNAIAGATVYAGRIGPRDIVVPREQKDRYRSWPQWHGHMMARNIIKVGGGGEDETLGALKIWDAPFIRDRVSEVVGDIMRIDLLYRDIIWLVERSDPREKWVIVNAWGVKDRLRERPLGAYTEWSPGKRRMAIYRRIRTLITRQDGREAFVVFAAGNAGLFTHDPEAGRYDRGPNRSIWGAALMPKVLTVGGCDVNGMWLGSASQGGERAGGAKPDVVAPSYFRDDVDAHAVSSGTSASCAVAAGLIVRDWRRRAYNNGPPVARRIRRIAFRSRKGGGPHPTGGGRFGAGVMQFGRYYRRKGP